MVLINWLWLLMTNDTNEDDDNDDISTNYTSCRQCAELFKYDISDKNS